MIKDPVALVQYLVDNSYLPADILELSENDLENYDTIEEKLRGEMIVRELEPRWAEVQYGNRIITLMDKDEGIEDYVKEVVAHMDDDDIQNLLGRLGQRVLQDWGCKLQDVDDYYINDARTARGARETIMASVNETHKKTAAAKGIGDYRRGDVLTRVTSVQPGQLLVLDSVVYKAINLIKVTQTFDDKFYAIFVNPENPAEKRQTSDEEFVVYQNDLGRGEYYIALEPSPKSAEPEGESEDTVKVEKEVSVEAPVPDSVPEESVDEKADTTEGKKPVASSVKAGNELIDSEYDEKRMTKEEEDLIWEYVINTEDMTDDDFHAFVEKNGFDPHAAEEVVYRKAREVTKELDKKEAIKSPVLEHEDYGELPDTAQERIDAQATVEKKAMGEEPASAYDTPSANPITVDDPTHSDEEPQEITSFSRYSADEPDIAMVDEDVVDEDEEEEQTESKYTLEYVPDSDSDSEDVFEDQDTSDSIVIVYEGALGTGPVAYYNGKEIARGTELDDLADDIQEYMEGMKYFPPILLEEERGGVAPLMLRKRGALDNFEIETAPNTSGDYEGVVGSQQSFASLLLAGLNQASAPGGLGDDGSAYDLLDGGGRNFTGVNEEDVEVVASQYIEGKAVSFASFEDLMGFAHDAYGVRVTSDKDFRSAWHADDAKALASLIAKHATKNELE